MSPILSQKLLHDEDSLVFNISEVEDSQILMGAPEECPGLHCPKCCENNNQDEDSSLNNTFKMALF